MLSRLEIYQLVPLERSTGAIDYFYKSLDLPLTPSPPHFRSSITVDFDALTQRDKLESAAELIHTVLQET